MRISVCVIALSCCGLLASSMGMAASPKNKEVVQLNAPTTMMLASQQPDCVALVNANKRAWSNLDDCAKKHPAAEKTSKCVSELQAATLASTQAENVGCIKPGGRNI